MPTAVLCRSVTSFNFGFAPTVTNKQSTADGLVASISIPVAAPSRRRSSKHVSCKAASSSSGSGDGRCPNIVSMLQKRGLPL